MKKNTPKLLTCTVDRSKWARGGPRGSNYKGLSELVNVQGNMCCLGFLGITCGVEPQDMLQITSPDDLSEELTAKYPAVASWDQFIVINDNSAITDADKEKALRDLAKKNGFLFLFVGE
jgi:hypothetical protein